MRELPLAETLPVSPSPAPSTRKRVFRRSRGRASSTRPHRGVDAGWSGLIRPPSCSSLSDSLLDQEELSPPCSRALPRGVQLHHNALSFRLSDVAGTTMWVRLFARPAK